MRIGVDVGSVRVGVAASDPDGRLALPVETLARRGSIDALAGLVVERAAVEVVVGLPKTMAGGRGPAVAAIEAYAAELAARIAPIPVRFVDERLTTAMASRSLSRSGRSTRTQRGVIDQAAAVLILQGWLDRQARGPATQ